MPLYDYSCEACGPFRDWRPMSKAADPVPCPTCEGSAARSVATPFVANMNPHTRIAHQRNEKSANEPQVMTREQVQKLGPKRGDVHGHHHHHHAHAHHHTHRSNRPWMIGH